MTSRLTAIDALRGAVMVLMALDHVRDFFHRGAMTASPTDLSQTTVAIFLTRLVTHVCAPVFVFTAGLGAYFWWQRGRTRTQLSTFLVSRGLWLILLELTVMQVGYYFDLPSRNPVLLLVLWVIGASMIGLAALVWLPMRWLAVLGVATIVLHHLADGVGAAELGPAAWLWNVLHQVGAFPVGTSLVIVGYPLIPWIAIMALGFCFGPAFALPPDARQRLFVRLGVAMMLGFVVLRALNVYGDPAPWSGQASAAFTALSFLNTTKYPPSLAFVLMTLGPALLALAYLDRRAPASTHPLVVFGRVPLFYFVLHFYLAHVAAVLFALIQYGGAALAFIFHPVPSMGGPRNLFPPNFGYDLWVTYVVWAAIVIGLYPACRWFARLKERRRDWWLSYL